MWGQTKTPRRLPPARRKPVKRRLWLQFLLFMALSFVVIGTVSGWRNAHATVTLNPETAAAGTLLFKGPAEGYQSAVMLASKVDFKINGMIAEVGLTQSFRNDSDSWREAVYVFPLPENAAVRAMRIQIGERVIEGEIHERQAAKRIYQQAKTAGKKAGLVEQERPNMFTTSVANIGPAEKVLIELQYVQTVAYEAGEFSLRFPMTITPRYIPGERLTEANNETSYSVSGAGWAQATDQVPDAARITPYQHPAPAGEHNIINPITIRAEINAGLPLTSVEAPWHDMTISRSARQYSLESANGPVSMNRDFELRWRPATGHEPQAALFTETVDDQPYALLMLLPPTKESAAGTLSRDMTFVIDTSGSMGGVSIEQARQGLIMALERLRQGDRFNVIEFNSAPNSLFAKSRPVTAERLQQAKRFVNGLRARGGTEMRSALDLALTNETDSEHLRQVIFMTDGAVGNEDALFKLIHNQLGNTRLFTVGIGSAPNSYFMRKAAQFGRGTYTYISGAGEVRERMDELFDKLASPVAGNLEVRWPDGIGVEAYPARVPDLYQGEPLLLAARLDRFSGEVTIRGLTANTAWQRQLQLESRQQSPGIASVWAREKIAALLDEKIAGRPEAEVRRAVLDVALPHRLVSPYTSFVAVEKTPSRPADADQDREAVANARPEGQSDQPYAWPATATNSRWQLLSGGLLLLLAVLLLIGSQRRAQYAS